MPAHPAGADEVPVPVPGRGRTSRRTSRGEEGQGGRLKSGRDGWWLLHVQRNARMHLRCAGGFDTMA